MFTSGSQSLILCYVRTDAIMEDTINTSWSGFTVRETRLGQIRTTFVPCQVVTVIAQRCAESEGYNHNEAHHQNENARQNRYIGVEIVEGE